MMPSWCCFLIENKVFFSFEGDLRCEKVWGKMNLDEIRVVIYFNFNSRVADFMPAFHLLKKEICFCSDCLYF